MPAHLEAAGLIRAVQAAGGFATVIHKGEREAGTIAVVLAENGANLRLFERMPSLDSGRSWTCTMSEDPENKEEFNQALLRRVARDPDLWIIELDIADGERFIP
ncbi:MAG: DUF1491 family protein [Novosphingobium sp.]